MGIPFSRPSNFGLVATTRPGCGIRKPLIFVKQVCRWRRSRWSSSCWPSVIWQQHTTDCQVQSQLLTTEWTVAQSKTSSVIDISVAHSKTPDHTTRHRCTVHLSLPTACSNCTYPYIASEQAESNVPLNTSQVISETSVSNWHCWLLRLLVRLSVANRLHCYWQSSTQEYNIIYPATNKLWIRCARWLWTGLFQAVVRCKAQCALKLRFKWAERVDRMKPRENAHRTQKPKTHILHQVNNTDPHKQNLKLKQQTLIHLQELLMTRHNCGPQYRNSRHCSEAVNRKRRDLSIKKWPSWIGLDSYLQWVYWPEYNPSCH